ncbi:hypothetical protein [Desulfobotulus sp.]|uniref:hypothetical protein n=1 Tax=Desulfobotulus sp. TaxID=1940337 RepID=UPI002A362173|nr:hypothetical protein [Desulfobotulus sp.]MDY0164293.1 hypothetical protein [Desulfobotulus sp.]
MKTMTLRDGCAYPGYSVSVRIEAGETETIHIPAPPIGRDVVVRVWPDEGQTMTVQDSVSPDADIRAGAGRWLPVQADGVVDGVASNPVQWAYVCPVSGIQAAGPGTLEVMT